MRNRGGDFFLVEPAARGEFGGVNAARSKEAVDAGGVGAGDVGPEAVADRQQASSVSDAEQLEASRIDRGMRLAVPAHPSADRLVMLGERPGAQRRLAVVNDDEIGV